MATPIITVGQMRKWERASWKAGRSASAVIDTVGRAIADRLLTLSETADGILFLAGKGHNGDDVRAACQHMGSQRAGQLLEVTEAKQGLADFQKAHRAGKFSWIVDGLFGIGLDRPLDAHWQKLINSVNRTKISVVSVDVPSGLNAETGEAEGAAIAAAVTLTVGAPKRGLLKASKFVGRLEVLPDIGLIPCPFETELNWTLASDFAGLPPRRPVESNKGTFGHVAIFAGSFGYHGAAVLAGHGALRAHPGLVTVFPQESVYVPVAAQCQSIMVHAWRGGESLPKNCSAILFGPGLAAPDLPDALKEEMKTFWRKSSLAVVADASALDWPPPGPTPRGAIRVVTPHPGEAGRLLGLPPAQVQADRAAALRKISKKLGGCFVLLKGNQTMVGRAGGRIFLNCSGNPDLAQGGSGDLLGGYLAGLLAQSDWQKDPETTIRYAAWQHGAGADYLSETQPNWTVEDLSRQIGRR